MIMISLATILKIVSASLSALANMILTLDEFEMHNAEDRVYRFVKYNEWRSRETS